MKTADIYVQPSRFEGYGITVAEAKCLCQFIITSDIPEFKELLNEKQGILCGNINEYIANIKKIIKSKSNRVKSFENKSREKSDQEDLKKLYSII